MGNIIMYTIKDEEGNYVHRNSIRGIGKNYYYLSYTSLEDGCIVYTSEERVINALDILELHNKLGNLGHKFSIELAS